VSIALKNKSGISVHGRNRARRLAAQALYQWQLTGQEISEIDKQFHEVRDLHGADLEYFQELLLGVTTKTEELDGILKQALDRNIADVDPVEQAILRIGVYELNFRADVPYRVVISEAVALTKKFGAEQSYTYVNGVLDRIARILRPQESAGA